MDFTLKKYEQLLSALVKAEYQFITFKEYVEIKGEQLNQGKFIILRHDVDLLPENSLDFARIQAKLSIRGTYYFRKVAESFNPIIMKEIEGLNHEVGYHYETMDSCNGEIDLAYQEFVSNLKLFREFVDVSTVSMHGSPISPFDNREIWQKYSYKDLGIIGEPYFDFDFNQVFYITDTGRSWNGKKFNVRDKAPKENPITNKLFLELTYSKTDDIIDAIQKGTYPSRVMMNFHPERWTNKLSLWIKQFVLQNLKNQVKWLIIAYRNSKK